MATNLTDPVVDAPELEPPPPDEPKGMYPSSPSESADFIEERKARIREIMKQAAEDQVELNRLQNEIAVLNSLRQANGQAPL